MKSCPSDRASLSTPRRTCCSWRPPCAQVCHTWSRDFTQSITTPLSAACWATGRRERSHSSQGQGEEQALPPEEDTLNVPQPSPAPLMQDPPDLDMDQAPPMDDGLLRGSLEGLDAMLPTPTPSGKSGSRSAGRTRYDRRTSGSGRVGSEGAWGTASS